MKTNIGLFLTKRAVLSPTREAYVDSKSGLRLTFTELNDRSNRVANALAASGVKQGDRVALLMMNSAEFIESYFAIAKLGGVVVPLNWRLVADELEFILRDSGAQTLIFGKEFIDVVIDLHGRGDKTDLGTFIQMAEGGKGETHFSSDYEALRDAASDAEPEIVACDDDLLYIMYTSGTTGMPKGCHLTHHNFVYNVKQSEQTLGGLLHDHASMLMFLPLAHIFARLMQVASVNRGSKIA